MKEPWRLTKTRPSCHGVGVCLKKSTRRRSFPNLGRWLTWSSSRPFEGFKTWGESNPSNGTQNGTRVCGQHNKVNNDKGFRASCVAPYGLQFRKGMQKHAFFASNTMPKLACGRGVGAKKGGAESASPFLDWVLRPPLGESPTEGGNPLRATKGKHHPVPSLR